MRGAGRFARAARPMGARRRKTCSVRLLRAILVLALLAVAAYAVYRFVLRPTPPPAGNAISVYYAKLDGATLVPWRVSLGPARDRKSVAFYAATQALAGPPSGVEAVRFPAGTLARAVDVDGSTVTVDLSDAITATPPGSFAESAEFKALVWTLTALPGIDSVAIRVAGRKLPTLPGGHLELDEPLKRSDF
jgi:spore germination protein GerM